MVRKAFANYSTAEVAQRGADPNDDYLIEDRVRNAVAGRMLNLSKRLSETAKKYSDPMVRQGFEECVSLLMIEASKIGKGEDVSEGDQTGECDGSNGVPTDRGPFKSLTISSERGRW